MVTTDIHYESSMTYFTADGPRRTVARNRKRLHG